MDSVVDRVLDLQEQVGSLHNFRFFEVTFPEELDNINCEPPAVAYVRKVGDFYFFHGPEFWLGRVGTPEARFSDREKGKWVRAPYSGDRALFRAVSIEYLSGKAQLALGSLIANGLGAFNANLYADLPVSGGFYKMAKELWYLTHNFQLAELNEQTCGTEGERLYDLEAGDIAVQGPGKAWCVQRRTKGSSAPLYFDRGMELIGEIPLIEGTPGLQIQKRKLREERVTISESHQGRLGFVVCESAIPKGATSFRAAIHPNSVPRPSIGGGSDWVSLPQGEFDGEPSYNLSAPGAPWDVNNFIWLQSPDIAVELEVTGFSPPSSGVMPDCLNASITLEQGCPMPLTLGNSVYERSADNYYLVKPSRAFGWRPRGRHGGYLGSSTIDVRVRYHTWSYIDVGAGGTPLGRTRVKPLWTWIGPAGHESHSPIRGITKDDLISIANYNYVYELEEVKSTKTQNPTMLTLKSGLRRAINSSWQTADGVWVSGSELYQIIGSLSEDTPMYTGFVGWSSPGGTGVPLIIRKINYNTVYLAAPVAKTIPAGTKMNVWASSDIDTVTYAYYDYHEFMFGLEQWVQYNENIGRSTVESKLNDLNILSEELEKARQNAIKIGKQLWYSYPYYVNARLDDYLPESFQSWGSTFSEVGTKISDLRIKLAKLLNTKPPSWNSVEYISLLQYSHLPVSE